MCSFLPFNKQSLLHVQALGFFFFFFYWKPKPSCMALVFQMPDPKQGLHSAGTRAPHGPSRRRHLRMTPQGETRSLWKSNPGKSARRDQHPHMNPTRHCCNSRQHFGHLTPGTTILTFLWGKTMTFGKYRQEQRLCIYAFLWRGKTPFLSQFHQNLNRGAQSDTSWWTLTPGKILPFAEPDTTPSPFT